MSVSVIPKLNCPHVNQHVINVLGVRQGYLTRACSVCNDSSESWYCLHCGGVFCSRYVQGHGVQHFNNSGHCILISFSDLSVWCYNCEDYIRHIKTDPALFLLHKTMFNVNHPDDT